MTILNTQAALSALLGWTTFLSWSVAAAATTDVATQPVGLMQIPIQPGANLISAPLHRIHTYRGAVATVSSSTFTSASSPGWTANQFAAQDGYYQFIVLVRKSAATGLTHEGDWWPIVSNDATSITVLKRTEDISTILQPGDQIEVRHLTTIKDMFGGTGNTVLNKDSNGFPNRSEEDLIRYFGGGRVTSEIFYHDGSMAPEGYYVDGDGPFDGSTLTLWPDQAFFVFRKDGSGPLSLKILGQVQTTRLTHYLDPAANAIGTGFALSSPVTSCGLLEAGWIGDDNGFPTTKEEDIIRTFVGSRIDKEIFYHNGEMADPGWYVDGILDPTFSLQPGQGYFIYIKGPGSLRWPQSAP